MVVFFDIPGANFVVFPLFDIFHTFGSGVLLGDFDTYSQVVNTNVDNLTQLSPMALTPYFLRVLTHLTQSFPGFRRLCSRFLPFFHP